MINFLTPISPSTESTSAIVLIPDIWGVTDYTTATAQSLASKYQRPVYVLDYFYELTGKANKFNPATDSELATGLMAKMTAQDFNKIFEMALVGIRKAQPSISDLAVVGFCFGGRLAYLTGLHGLVNKIISFYGAGSVNTNFCGGESVVEALCKERKTDSRLKVLAFFGTEDHSIPKDDRQAIGQLFANSSISYEAHEYPAGHAYFQQGRDSYDSVASSSSWKDLDKFLV